MRVISFEGIAGAGKSTIVKMSKEYLETLGLNVYVHKPIRRASLTQITEFYGVASINVWTMTLPNMYYKDELFCLWTLLMTEQHKIVGDYDVVLIDRYLDTISGLCYTKANLFHDKVSFPDFYSFLVRYLYPQIIVPDLTFLFNINHDIASIRTLERENRQYSSEDIEMFNGIYHFNKLTSEKEERFMHINSSVPIADVFNQVKPFLLER